MSAEPTHAKVAIDGMSMHWAELGSASAMSGAPPLVLLHGIMDSHLTWNAVAPMLATDRRVLMPDLFGCGLSDRPNASYALEWHAKMIARWLEALGLTQVDVVGHSFGGGVAQMLLLACPERIRRIALVASGGLGRDVGFWLKLAAFPKAVEYFGQPFMSFGTRRTIGGARRSSSALDVDALSAMNAKRGTARAFSRTVRDVIRFGGQTRHFSHRASEVSTLPPIRVFWGDRDHLIPIAHGNAFVASTEGVQLVVFAGCGHYLHQEQPEAFAKALLAFLDAADLPAARLRAPVVPPPALAARAFSAADVVRRVRERLRDTRARLLQAR